MKFTPPLETIVDLWISNGTTTGKLGEYETGVE
jgi:hypothetical protein